MDSEMNTMLRHMAYSVKQLARMLESDRHVTVQMSKIVQSIDADQPFDSETALLQHSETVFKSITSYLNSLASLEDTVAQQLSYAVQVLKEQEDGE